MNGFLGHWSEAAQTSLGFFWMALWAFALGYLISSLIQVLVTRDRMQRSMGESGTKAMALGTFFGFISSSCSFAALSTTRTPFQKGAGLAPAMAFMLASTNLVIELGFVIAIFLSWQFVVGEYVGGLLLILFAWAFIRLTRPKNLIEQTRKRLENESSNSSDDDDESWVEKLRGWDGWQQIGTRYVMEWRMVWKDVLIGFTVAGIISTFVPDEFFQALFIGSGGDGSQDPGFAAVLVQTLVGPVAAFFTFIGSMGNIPLAAVLFGQGVSFAGVMAFIFSDLVVFPVLRINAQYYGWKMAFYIMAMLLAGLVVVALAMHYGLLALDLLPRSNGGTSVTDRDMFALNYGFFLNLLFLAASGVLAWLWWRGRKNGSDSGGETSVSTYVMRFLSVAAVLWLGVGSLLTFIV